MTTTTKRTTALDVKNGDVIYLWGCRCEVSNVQWYNRDEMGRPCEPFQQYTLHSADGDLRLPAGYEGMTSGGNRWAYVDIEG